MAISQAMCTSFKVELLKGVHDFTSGQDTFNLALYVGATASLGAGTTAYTTTGEVSCHTRRNFQCRNELEFFSFDSDLSDMSYACTPRY